MVWKPHVTVSAVAKQDNRYLLVEERASGRRVFNNPAGHLEADETLDAAVRREVLEETGYQFVPEAVTGVYLWKHPHKKITFLRVNFAGHCDGFDPGHELDSGIIGPHWLEHGEIRALGDRLRSPLVLRSIDDFEAGKRYPLDLFTHLLSGAE